MLDQKLAKVQDTLFELDAIKDLPSAKAVIRSIVELLIPGITAETKDIFRIYNDKDGKLKANSGWFQSDDVIADRLAVYSVDLPTESNLDVKVFAVNKANKGTISWAVGLTPNYEDEPFNGRFNVGIDFFIPKSMDKVIVALSKNYVIRTVELRGKLTATYLEILNSWIAISDTSRKPETHTLLWNSLDLQPINKKFYEGISQRFISLRQHLESTSTLDTHHSAQFANRLIGRIIFAWFLERKGLIDKDSDYFESKSFEDDSLYYRAKLEPLFFEVLNTPVVDRKVVDLSTPYLNGGLFEAKPEDLYGSSSLTFPKKYFDDLYEFLHGYNFTTDESTSDFQQVAIDPEMLGRIFENLLAEVSEETGEQARKAKGAFYTPREIVDYMCKEALKGYLRKVIPQDDFLEQRIYQLVDATERQFQDQDHNWRRDLKPYKNSLISALDNLKVLDPACGSGAFPIGMMQLLVRVYARIEPRFDYHKAKLAIIEKNIFGVDLEPMAVEISRLRAWLSLIVDEDSNSKAIHPLPNLDFKFVSANSLVALEPAAQLSFFEDDALDEKLQQIRDSYFKTESLAHKSKLKQKYSALVQEELSLFGESKRTSQLKSFRPFDADSVAGFFDPMQMFGFNEFDIVIGNPPYVRHERISYKGDLKPYELFQSTADLYTYFYELAAKSVSEGGIVSFISSSKFGRTQYGAKLREFLSKQKTINYIVDFDDSHVFAAVTNTWIVQFANSQPKPESLFRLLDQNMANPSEVAQASLSGASWNFFDEEEGLIFGVMEKSSSTLGDMHYEIRRGIQTGCNAVFVVDSDIREDLVGQDSRISSLTRLVLKGRDIRKYGHLDPSSWLLVTRDGLNIEDDYPALASFLTLKDEELSGKAKGRWDQGRTWMNLRACDYYEKFDERKIIFQRISAVNSFSLSTAGEYLLDTAFMINGENLEYLLGVLNSKAVLFYMLSIASSTGMSTIEWKKFTMDRIPVPIVNDRNRELAKLVTEQVISIQNSGLQPGSSEFQRLTVAIDQTVYALYGLNDTQAAFVDKAVDDYLAKLGKVR